MKTFFVTCAILLPLTVFAQGTLSVDKTEIRIGDQVHATVKLDLSEGKEWVNTDAFWPDSLKGIEIVSGPTINKENPSATLATWVVAFFDTGWVRIPPLPIVIQYQSGIDTVLTNDIPINVMPVEPDSTGLAPIKDIYLQPFSVGYYKRYIPHAIIFLLAVVGLIYWWRHRKRNQVIPEPTPVPLLPHQWAYQALDSLADKKLWQHGEVKEHYTNLTAILREYLERRFGIRALEQTSDEIVDQLRFQLTDASLLIDTEQLLSVADLIKFAKADPGIDIHAATIERGRIFVRNTTLSFDPREADQLNQSPDEVVE
jgi:hypothetical protein